MEPIDLKNNTEGLRKAKQTLWQVAAPETLKTIVRMPEKPI